MKVTEFLGLNNVADRTRLRPGEFFAATDVDVGPRAKLYPRASRRSVAAGRAHSPYVCELGVFAVVDFDLVLMNEAGAVQRVVYPSLGHTRVWYARVPDGRVAFSNGLIHGLASATSTDLWGVPEPADAGACVAGDTPYEVTYVRSSDGLEGAPVYGGLTDPREAIVNLPVLAGHTINVYFAPYGDQMFLAGNTATDTFYPPANAGRGPQSLERGVGAPRPGTQLAWWRTRMLSVQGNVVWATRPLQFERCDYRQDFFQVADPVTLLYPTPSGVFVGTAKGLDYLSGERLDALTARRVSDLPVTLGSLAETRADLLNEDARPPADRCALCLVGGSVAVLADAGFFRHLTAERYRRDFTEVYATAREAHGGVQYAVFPA